MRIDNADERLTPIGRRVGLVSDERWALFEAKRRQKARLIGVLGMHRHGTWLKRPMPVALMFAFGWWYYGPEMVSIFASIRDGRPHCMPAYRRKMTTEQIWQLAGYVQTIGAYSAKTAAPGRDDDKQPRPAENRAPAAALFDQGPRPLHLDQGPAP